MTKASTSKITLWLSIGVLVVAIIAALVIFLVPSDTPEPSTEQTQRPTSAPTETSAVGAVGCAAPASDERDVPSDLRWEAKEGVTWPVSDSVGPTAVTKGFAACFEHSPVGASLAAVTFVFSQVDHTPLEATEFYVADSPGKKAMLSQLDENTESRLTQQIASSGVSIAGFQIEEYDGDRTLVRVILRVPASPTGFRGLPVPLIWEGGDWKVKPLDTGSTGQASDVSEGEFTPWAGASNG
ncbi:hypothetical protein ALI44B_00260 [Leifsonia sp. ALI-44-B]|uniref:hypothetical protein n=1 Tax=Leifsonia sp. ALI-44-B TaxID=1933776 RepID=UPI00097C1A9D|nr:hypothetical protein [Leifsonia sp. ALI-44-B]ONI65425.1 hypothetical protein ALI44B_00260 [Leifsonia sp. ALI-44-B]